MLFSPVSRLSAFLSCCHSAITLNVVGPPGSQPKTLDNWSDVYGVGGFDWSPNGHLIAYQWVNPPPDQTHPGPAPGRWHIAVIAPDGHGRRLLTTGIASENFWPLFSPDGRSILFCAENGPREGYYTVPTTGGPVQRLSHRYCDLDIAAWSPNGREIAYTSNVAKYNRPFLFVMNIETSHVKRLAGPLQTWPRNLSPVAWSPDGRKIAFANSNLVETINSDGTGVRNLVPIPNSYIPDLVWSPDGKRIAMTVSPPPTNY